MLEVDALLALAQVLRVVGGPCHLDQEAFIDERPAWPHGLLIRSGGRSSMRSYTPFQSIIGLKPPVILLSARTLWWLWWPQQACARHCGHLVQVSSGRGWVLLTVLLVFLSRLLRLRLDHALGPLLHPQQLDRILLGTQLLLEVATCII